MNVDAANYICKCSWNNAEEATLKGQPWWVVGPFRLVYAQREAPPPPEANALGICVPHELLPEPVEDHLRYDLVSNTRKI